MIKLGGAAHVFTVQRVMVVNDEFQEYDKVR